MSKNNFLTYSGSKYAYYDFYYKNLDNLNLNKSIIVKDVKFTNFTFEKIKHYLDFKDINRKLTHLKYLKDERDKLLSSPLVKLDNIGSLENDEIILYETLIFELKNKINELLNFDKLYFVRKSMRNLENYLIKEFDVNTILFEKRSFENSYNSSKVELIFDNDELILNDFYKVINLFYVNAFKKFYYSLKEFNLFDLNLNNNFLNILFHKNKSFYVKRIK